jgi:prolyl oligopeptidase
MERAHHQLLVFEQDGTPAGEIPLPTMGTILSMAGRRHHRELFISFNAFLLPTSIFRYDFADGGLEPLWATKLSFMPEAFVTEQHVYPSRDGTEVTIFVTHRRDLELNGRNPTLLYGYGGFNISQTPGFSSSALLWVERGGVYAVANLRGGGEYGEAWHQAGMLDNKQNVFDDFIAAAGWLIDAGYTTPSRLAIHGRSNGGLLTAATLLQRPDLFGAVLCGVPVIDMLRYQRFTAGRYWVAEYGDPDNPEHFQFLMDYSPLHNVRPGTVYPPTLVYSAEGDDRVVPLHALKFVAALQAADAGNNPLLLRFDTKSGHGLGKPTAKVIDEYTDLMTFGLYLLGQATKENAAP